ncbi:MAG: DUF3592 domain-containing protein [Chloroflexi bacterium]|nr:DUF3592 domain-containing protein [Chloroflexota bacterium]OJV96542.1 MAG: hypothetical protein BGO39_09790 [Chloroflexi bacterium 54-19]
MAKPTYQEQADQALRESLAFYAANPLPASHRFAMNPANQPYLNCAEPHKKIPFIGKIGLLDFFSNGNNRDSGKSRPAILVQLLAALLCLALAVGAVYWIYSTFDLNNLLMREGVVANATVVDKYTRDSPRSTNRSTERNYYLTFELVYPAANGQSQTLRKTESVSQAIYSQHKVGGPLQVIYAPSDPNKLLISNTGSDLGMTLLLAAAIIPLGLGTAVYQFGKFVWLARKRGKLKRGRMLTGYITTRQTHNNIFGKPSSVKLGYKFISPEGQHLAGEVTFPAKNFKGRWHIVEIQKPLVVLYRNERKYEVL